jgi:hypothetical protein
MPAPLTGFKKEIAMQSSTNLKISLHQKDPQSFSLWGTRHNIRIICGPYQIDPRNISPVIKFIQDQLNSSFLLWLSEHFPGSNRLFWSINIIPLQALSKDSLHWPIINFLFSWNSSADDTKQCATLLELQEQSVVARVNFSHEGTWGLYRTLEEKFKKALFILVRQPAKQSHCLASPTPPSGCQAQGVECK